MNQIKRYGLGTMYEGNVGCPAIVEQADGEYVTFKDYDAVLEAIGAGGVSLMGGQPAMPADVDVSKWMECETRRPFVVNSLKSLIRELRDSEQRCRTAFKKDFLGKPSQYLADAYGEAAAVFESRLSALDARRRIEVE